jgi:phosphopantetheine--protein transferase-like protein
MDQTARLTEIVARLCRVAPTEISPGFSLESLVARSIDVHLLESALRKHLDIVPPPLHGMKTYQQLEATVLGTSRHPPPTASEPSAAERLFPSSPGREEASRTRPPLTCGVDVEHVSELPTTADYWTHEFYVNTFTSAEIAYCARQTAPLPHFAARWCAKEALKKCDPAFLAERMTAVQITHDEHGAPALESVITHQILPFAVSLTHSNDIAAAIVVRLGSPAIEAPGPPGYPALTAGGAVQASTQSAFPIGSALACMVALLSLIVSGIALWRTYGL